LTYAAGAALFPLATRDACPHTWTVVATAAHDWLEHFWSGGSGGEVRAPLR
jgi:hypothetical protein